MKNIWFPVFVALSLLHIVGVISNTEILCTISKPVLMPILALWLMKETRDIKSPLRTAWLIGLFFSTLGDILLMFSGGSFFLLGLSAFLLAHLSYIGGISKGLKDRRGFLLKKPLWILPFLLFPIVLLYWLWEGIPGGMRIPVAVYALVIATMAQSVANLKGYISNKIFWTMMGGAVLFVLSDSLIAVNKFGHAFDGGRVAVIGTYMLGQWLLVLGVSRSLKETVILQSVSYSAAKAPQFP